MEGHEGQRHAAAAPQKFVSRTSLATAIKVVAARDLSLRYARGLKDHEPQGCDMRSGYPEPQTWRLG
jgi:hypothetical protein